MKTRSSLCSPVIYTLNVIVHGDTNRMFDIADLRVMPGGGICFVRAFPLLSVMLRAITNGIFNGLA